MKKVLLGTIMMVVAVVSSAEVRIGYLADIRVSSSGAANFRVKMTEHESMCTTYSPVEPFPSSIILILCLSSNLIFKINLS